ncbi:Protein arginine N-methyltransferase [Sergentomyia squamirostris]
MSEKSDDKGLEKKTNVEKKKCDSSDEDSDGWEEMEKTAEMIKCLFCENINTNFDDAIEHLKKLHEFDFFVIHNRHELNHLSYLQLIYFIYSEKLSPCKIMEEEDDIWGGSDFPTASCFPEDKKAWMTFDIEGFIEDQEEIERKKHKPSYMCNSDDEEKKEMSTIKASELRDLKESLSSLRKRYQALDNDNKELKEIVSALRESALKSLVDEDKKDEKEKTSLKDDESYFTSYSHYGIHQEMLCDAVRTESYRDAIAKNTSSIKGKIVMDLGCGTGILSMFASQTGAKRVISVDQSDIIYQAMDIARRNKMSNIKFLKGKIEEISLPSEKVDVIVSEWMGYFLLFEGMLDSVIYARDRYLTKGGMLFPNRCNISLVGSGDVDRHRERIGFWESVYGFDMSSMKDDVLREASVEVCKPDTIITESNIIADFNLMIVTTNCYSFSYNFNLKVTRKGSLTSLVGYFDTFFDLPTVPVEFSTGPHAEPTHWKQVVFFLPTPVEVTLDDVISGTFTCQRNPKDPRSLMITIKMQDQELEYNFM